MAETPRATDPAQARVDEHPAAAAPVAPEPLCCREPMVHNSWTCEYECADAYFALVDEYGAECVPFLAERDVSAEMLPTFRHWRESMVSDDTEVRDGAR